MMHYLYCKNSGKEFCIVFFIVMLTSRHERKQYIHYLPFVKKHIEHVIYIGANGLLLAGKIILMINIFKVANVLEKTICAYR